MPAAQAHKIDAHPQVYCEMINLHRAHDRRAHMKIELAQAGIEAEFHPAFDFKQSPMEVLQQRTKAEGPWGPFHTPNRAVTISHALAWERFLQTDASHCLIFEDDVFISPDLGEWMRDLSWWPEGADIVKFENWRSNKLKVLLDTKGSDFLGRKVSRMLSRHMGAAAYMLSRDAAKNLLRTEPFDMVVDHILFNINASRVAGAMRIYQVHPAMVEQGNEPPNGTIYMGQRIRPTGLALVRQKLKRGYYELAYPLSTVWQAITGSAKLVKVTFEPTVPTAPRPAQPDSE